MSFELPKRTFQELKEVHRRLQEDQFEIALVGEFQGGKSTTFNALCDGQVLSPMGWGIKTSATVVSAQNIAGAETKNGLAEWAEVEFRSKGEIALGFAGLLKDKLKKDQEFRRLHGTLSDEDFEIKMSYDNIVAELVDLDKREHRSVLERLLKSLWEEKQQDPMAFDEEKLDQLRIATLQVKHYGCPEYQELCRKNVMELHEFQNLVTFPQGWSGAFKEGWNTSLKCREVAFVFIRQVLLRLHAHNLGRLGCRITDCPGLFANAYDTKVAREVMRNADAIWYLVNGEKQLGQGDLKVLKEEIHGRGWTDKVKVSCNLKGDHQQKIKEVMVESQRILKEKGFPWSLQPYDAKLSFLATQGDLLLKEKEKFTGKDWEYMKKEARVKEDDASATPEKAWGKVVRRQVISSGLEELEEIEKPSPENVAAVRRESYLDDILNSLEQEFVSRKSKVILVDKGSHRASQAMVEYEGELKNKEENADQIVEKFRKKCADQREMLMQFCSCANCYIRECLIFKEKYYFALKLAREFWKQVFEETDFFKEFIEELTKSINKVNHELHWTEDTTRGAILSDFGPKFIEIFQRYSERKALEWTLNPVKGESLRMVRNELLRINKEISNMWRGELEEITLMQGVDWSEIGFIGDFNLAEAVTGLEKTLNNPLIADLIKKVRHGIFGFIFYKALNLFNKFFDKKKEGKERVDKSEVKENLKHIFLQDPSREELHEDFAELYGGIFATLLAETENDYLERQEELKEKFEQERVQPVEESFKQSQGERQRLAKENRRVRVEKIEPLRKKIQAFEAEVCRELS